MEILSSAVSGTMESSDCMVSVSPGSGKIEIQIESIVLNQFGDELKKTIENTLKELDVSNVKISLFDRGALDLVIKSRIECAIERAKEKK
ncbi:MAG: citrate lyase acyl carrier protein [Eubacteriales bacterium]|nr:citrate lyase acyl carrier protein [Eubacteriales bacterium]